MDHEPPHTDRVNRRLAAILAADMVGYSRLMHADELGTLERQKRAMAEVFKPGIAAHRGRLVKTTGDGLLVEFSSAMDAVMCAVALQRDLTDRAGRDDDALGRGGNGDVDRHNVAMTVGGDPETWHHVAGVTDASTQEEILYLDGEEIELTATEFKLLLSLIESPGITQERADLLKKVWGYSDMIQTRTLDTHIKRLREKLTQYGNSIETVRGIGYRRCVG